MRKNKVLFVCGRNQWRSPTAVQLYRNDQRIDVRSAGVSESSKQRLGIRELLWADIVLVMESKYRSWIVSNFRDHDLPPIASLDIPDDYQYMDEELIELLYAATEPHIIELGRLL